MKFIALLVAIVALVAGCQSDGSRQEEGGAFDGTFMANIHRTYEDSNGDSSESSWEGLIAIDQRGDSINWWGVVAEPGAAMEPGGPTVAFGSQKYGAGAFYYTYQKFVGGGDQYMVVLSVKADAADASGNEFFQSISRWVVLPGEEYFKDGWEDLPPQNFMTAAVGVFDFPIEGKSLLQIEDEFGAPRIQAAYEASR